MVLLGKVALGIVGTAVAGVGVLCSEGMIEVKVVERQPEVHHVYVIAPAMLVPIGMHFAPQRKLSHAAAQIRPWLPTIRAALEQLRESDDLTLVEVKEPGEHVRVAKQGGSIVVDVEDRDDTVHVSTPIRVISSTIEQLAASAPSI
ncbi:MAG TPA: hypothetical protein VN881_13145 [Candidatus Acidoferrales bacterium]|nr:hypothetical protein [Candidatus Acidoferrales bacterium]